MLVESGAGGEHQSGGGACSWRERAPPSPNIHEAAIVCTTRGTEGVWGERRAGAEPGAAAAAALGQRAGWMQNAPYQVFENLLSPVAGCAGEARVSVGQALASGAKARLLKALVGFCGRQAWIGSGETYTEPLGHCFVQTTHP